MGCEVHERNRVELEKCPVSLVKEGINVGTHGDSNLGKDGMNEENCLFSERGKLQNVEGENV
jgi:hypothetical protein